VLGRVVLVTWWRDDLLSRNREGKGPGGLAHLGDLFHGVSRHLSIGEE